jgi:hypothetical protein
VLEFLFFAFDLFRSGDIFGGQFSQFGLRIGVAHSAGVPPAFVGLISQMDGALRHGGRPSKGPRLQKGGSQAGQSFCVHDHRLLPGTPGRLFNIDHHAKRKPRRAIILLRSHYGSVSKAR